jgi:Ca2+-binding EF-hand superfamily protein
MNADKTAIDLTNLNQIFLKYDDDHDGKVNAQQTLNIFNEIGYNDLYLGSVKKVKHHS